MQSREEEETTELQTQRERAVEVQFPPGFRSRAHTASSQSRGNRSSTAPPASALLPARRRQYLPSSALSPQLFPSASLFELSGSFPLLASFVVSPPYIFSTPLPLSLATQFYLFPPPLFIEDFFLT